MSAPLSPVPPPSGTSKLDSLSKEDLIKFAKKQVANLAETRKNQAALMEKLKAKLEELEEIKALNLKLTAENAENIEKCEKLKEMTEKATKGDMLALEMRDLESKVDNLNRALREKTEALIKAHEVISENDERLMELQNNAKVMKGQLEQVGEENKSLASGLREEKQKSSDLEARLRSTECRINELSDKQGCEKLGLAKKMAESENRGRLLEEAIEALKNENEKLRNESEGYSTKLEQVEKEFLDFKNKAHFILEKRGKQEEDSREVLEDLERSKEMAKELEIEVERIKKENSRNVEELGSWKSRAEKLEKEVLTLRTAAMEEERNHLEALDDLRNTKSKKINRLEEELRIVKSSREATEQKYQELSTAKEKLAYLLQTERQRSENENGNLKNKLENSAKMLKMAENELAELKIESESNKERKQRDVAMVAPQQVHQVQQHVEMPAASLHRPVQMNMSDSVSCFEENTQPDRSLEDVLYGNMDEYYKNESLELTEEKFQALLEEIENMKKTNVHISDLLSEAESANGRLVSQNTLLKEEIRRLEREEKREEELKNENNMEYLKNVVVQFLKPESVRAERDQLVIVLQRVLHLSPKEVELLKAAAEQMSNAQEANNGGWGSYFSGWSGK